MTTQLELAELRALVKVVQAGSFTKAADRLGTQKAHLSRVVTKLERKLKARLLERSTRALTLTEVGREIYQRAVGALAAVEETERAAQRFHAAPQGLLRLTCGVEFGVTVVNQWVREYLSRYDAVRVDVDYTARLVDLIHEGFDIAIRVGQMQDSQLVSRKLGNIGFGLFASPDYLARKEAPADPEALKKHDILAFSVGNSISELHLQQDDKASVKVPINPRLSSNNSFATRDAARAGLGIAQLPFIIARDHVDSGELVQVLPAWRRPPAPVHAVFPSSHYLSPKVRAFINLSIERFPDA